MQQRTVFMTCTRWLSGFVLALFLVPAIHADENYDKGVAALKKKDYLGAIDFFKIYLKYDTDNADVYLNLGKALLGNNEVEKAVVAFTDALEINPEKTEATIWRAKAYIRQGNVDQAIADFDETLKN